MYPRRICVFLLAACLSQVWCDDPDSEIVSLTGGRDKETNLETQLKETIKNANEEIERIRQFVAETQKKVFANTFDSNQNVNNILELHNRISNLTSTLYSQIGSLKEQGKLQNVDK